MKRFVKTAFAAALSVTLSFMCVPAGAITALASTDPVIQADGDITAPTEVDSPGESGVIDGTFSFSYDGKTSTSIKYHYADSYFTEDSTTYNPHLATLSLDMAMAAYGSHTGTKDEDYAEADSNVKDFMGQLGFQDYACTEDFHKVPNDTSVGAAISHKEIKDASGNNYSVIAIAVRGGNYQQEWSGNATTGKSGEDEGFAVARDKVIKLLNGYLSDHKDTITQQPKFWIVGYSRGSAIENLTSNFLNCAMEHVQKKDAAETDLMASTVSNMSRLEATQTGLYGYGFEVPAGASDTSQYICSGNYTNIWNIIDPADPVPMLAPALWGFYRYGTDVDPTKDVSNSEVRAQLGKISESALETWDGLKTNKEGNFKLYNAGIYETCVKFLPNIGSYKFTDYDVKPKSYKHDFLQALVNFTAGKIGTREGYVENFQPMLKVLARVFFAGGDVSKFADVFASGLKKGAKNYSGLAKAILMGALYPSSSIRKELDKFAVSCIHAGLMAVKDDKEASSIFLDGELDTLIAHEDSLGMLIFEFLYDDAWHGNGIPGEGGGDGTLIPTAYMYSDELISAHDPHFVLAYMQANDSNCSEQAGK